MKLWQKITVICSAILIVTVSICCFLFINRTKDTILSITYKQASEKQRSLQASFTEMSNYYTTQGDTPAAKRSLLHYCFRQFADSTSVLIIGGETVYSNVEIHPEQLLPIETDYYAIVSSGQQKQFTGRINEKAYLIVGNDCRLSALPGSSCFIYVVEDITDVHGDINRIIWQFMLIGTLCTVAGLALIIILIRRSMHPLVKLQNAAVSIAEGNYHERSEVTSSDEVGVLASSFNQMAESVENHVTQLQETARRQQLFIGGVTHEFKTPLTAILLNADTLQNTYMSEKEQIDALVSIETQGKWLERLVQKMLKLLTMNQDITLKQISVPELLDHVNKSVSEALLSRGVSLEIQCDIPFLKADFDLLQSALVNLVENAGKASAPGQVVSLRAYGHVLEVSDHGIGIPKESLNRITDAFYMVDKSRSKKMGGVGLGLALVKEIVQAHGAALEIESELGAGTTVRIYFPGNKTVTQR